MPRLASPATSITTAVLLLLQSCLFRCPAVHAQQLIYRYESFSTFIEGRGLFIGGGRAAGLTSIVQPFVIDLSVNWSTSSPKYEIFPDGPTGSDIPNTISPDGKLWLVGVQSRFYMYNFEQKQWISPDSYLELSDDSDIRGFGAVTDIENGLIYVPNAFPNNMMRINTLNATGPSYDKIAMPSQMSETAFLSVAWSVSSQKMYIMGGMDETRAAQNWKMFSYSEKEGWVDLSTSLKGTVPIFRKSGCFVPAYDGTKMIFFGGSDEAGQAYGDLFLLDVATLTWTKGASTTARRQNAPCAVSGDYFISWVGESDYGAGLSNSTLSYDLKTSRWVTTYIAPPPSATRTPKVPTLSPTSPVSPSTNNPGPGSSSVNGATQVAVIVGAVLGGVAVAIVAGIFFLFRVRRKRAQNSIKNSAEPSASTGDTDSPPPVKKPPRNPHFIRLTENSTTDGGVPSQRSPQARISQQPWPPKDIPSQPHSPISTSGSFYPFSYPISHAPQEGSMNTSWTAETPHNPHAIVKSHHIYQGGLDEYSDFSPMTMPSYGDSGSYRDTDLILMDQMENPGIYRS